MASSTASISHLSTDVVNQWYAVALSTDVVGPKSASSRTAPMGLTVLGCPIVLWRDQYNEVRCVEDKCPHRSVPLSLGRNIGGQLECRYHGWQIDGASGSVCHIPALQDGAKIPNNAKCTRYEAFEQDGVIWVWMGADDEAGRLAARSKLPPRDQIPEWDTSEHNAGKKGLCFCDKDSGYSAQLLCVDLPIDHALMVENLLDPAHVPFAHEGTIGKRQMIQQLSMNLESFSDGIKGWVKKGYFNAFVAPCTVVLNTPPKPGSMDLWQFVACTPTSPKRMRMIYRAYRNFGRFLDHIPALKRYLESFSVKVIFQDYDLLAAQQQRLEEKALAWNSSIQVDSLPLLYRRFWRRTYGAGYKNAGAADGEEGASARASPWWKGWDGSLHDIEDLDRPCSGWGFDRDGIAAPMRPYHPQNPLEPRQAVESELKETAARITRVCWQAAGLAAIAGVSYFFGTRGSKAK